MFIPDNGTALGQEYVATNLEPSSIRWNASVMIAYDRYAGFLND